MIFILVIIYGILFRMKNNQIINTIESFETNLPGIRKIEPSMIESFLHGSWLGKDSVNLGQETFTNTMNFNMVSNNEGNMIYKGETYKVIDFTTNSGFKTNTVNGIYYKFNINFNITEEYRTVYGEDVIRSSPCMEIISFETDNTRERRLVFKFIGGKVGANIGTIVEYDKNSPQISGVLFDNEYVNSVKNYKFRNDAIYGVYENIDSIVKNISEKSNLKKLKEKYNNIMSFQIRSDIAFSNNQKVTTPFSQEFKIPYIVGDTVLTKIRLRSLEKELSENKLSDFYDITRFVYFFRIDSYGVEYQFDNPEIQFGSSALKLKNGADNFFEDNMYASDIRSVSKEMNASFKPVIIATTATNTGPDYNKKESVKKIITAPLGFKY